MVARSGTGPSSMLVTCLSVTVQEETKRMAPGMERKKSGQTKGFWLFYEKGYEIATFSGKTYTEKDESESF